MFEIRVEFGSEATEVAVRWNVLREVGALLRKLVPTPPGLAAVVITDKVVGAIYGADLLKSLQNANFQTLEYRIEPGERSKSLAVAGEIYEFLSNNTVGRDAVVVALGGGVVSDLAGFVAATWMRGIRFAVCPTTLEADVDASLGGKTAINLEGGKNLVGAFHQPILVAVDPACLQTLDTRDLRAGLAESIKHALITSEEFFSWHETNGDAILALDQTRITELILRNLRIKAKIVEQDAQERTGLRMLLNFGHTMGHAIEACCGFALRHGECVALGMLAACRLSQAVCSLDESVVKRVEAILTRFGLPTQLAEGCGTALRAVPHADSILAAIRLDKKIRGGAQRFVLLEGIGRPTVRDDIPEQHVREAYESLLP